MPDQTGTEARPKPRDDEPTLRRSTHPNALRCFECGELGHHQTACPNQPRRGLLLDDANKTNDLDDALSEDETPDDTMDIHHTNGDEGHLLVLHHICLTLQQREDHWLRTNIFRSTCTIRGRVCTFIIDSSSCRNVISESAIQKLGLPIEDHPNPYSLSWFQDGVAVRVSKRTLVPFSIGQFYKDRFYFDIAPMDVSHLILG